MSIAWNIKTRNDVERRYLVAFAAAAIALIGLLLLISLHLNADTLDEKVPAVTTERSLGLVDEGDLCGPDGIALPAQVNADGFVMLCWDNGDGRNRWHLDPRQFYVPA